MQYDAPLFSLSIDNASKEHLNEAAKWGRFLAITGFVFLGLLILSGIVTMSAVNRLQDYGDTGLPRQSFGMFGAATFVFYLLAALIYFFPLLYLLRFSNALRTALAANEQEQLIVSFDNLKRFLRFVGILTIIALALMALSIIMVLIGAGLSS